MKLTTLKPKVATLETTRRTHAAGDQRIRGSALQTIRERILTRDCGMCRCARCQATGEVKPGTIVDHITPLWAGGSESDSNRQAINPTCHEAKSAHETACRLAGSFVPWDGA